MHNPHEVGKNIILIRRQGSMESRGAIGDQDWPIECEYAQKENGKNRFTASW